MEVRISPWSECDGDENPALVGRFELARSSARSRGERPGGESAVRRADSPVPRASGRATRGPGPSRRAASRLSSPHSREDAVDVLALVVADGGAEVVAGRRRGSALDDQAGREVVGRQDRARRPGSRRVPGRCPARGRSPSRGRPSGRGSSRCRRRRRACPGCVACLASRTATSSGMSSRRSRRGGRWIETTLSR